MFSKFKQRAVLSLAIAAAFILNVPTSRAAFHLWQVKEAYSNADGSVQFVEMFDSFGGENFVGGFTLTANSDGTIKTFTFPSNLSLNTPGSLLIATPGFGSLPGGVTPDFTFTQGGVSGQFFNPNATNLTFTYNGSADSMSFAGASLPKDGIHSLTDAGAVGFPPGTPSISSGVNSPTNLSGQSGSVNLAPEPTSGVIMLLLSGALYFGRRSCGRRSSP
jgi:serralysin